jgi:hypothetical protein
VRNFRIAVETIERPRVANERRIAVLAHVRDDLRHTAVGLGVPYPLRRKQLANRVPIG